MLPSLREELALFDAPRTAEGQPSWAIHDPPRNRYFHIDWLSFEILARWRFGDPDAIVRDINASTPLHAEAEDVDEVIEFLSENQLLQAWGADAANQLTQRERKQHSNFWRWLLHNYLFIRIPLVRPNELLDHITPGCDFLYSKTFARLTLLAFVIGLTLLYRDWAHFSAAFIDTISWQGMLHYAIAIVFVKILHEFGHAVTAKRYGCRVPTMGIAFLVLWPMPYTDTNDVWQLQNRKQRLHVAAAGVMIELIVAVWATLAWAFLADGAFKSIAFVLATTTWIMSLAINWSPFMRFDGYFLLADAINMPNLHNRSFALARWALRERLFGIGEPPPEDFSPHKQKLLVMFAWGTWIYRLFLFLGIAVLVYHFFIKAVGIFLFIVEIIWFIARPIFSELKVWQQKWPEIKMHHKRYYSFGFITGMLILLFVIWPSAIKTSGELAPTQNYKFYTPGPAKVQALFVKEGQQVNKGDILLRLDSPDLSNYKHEVQNRISQYQQALHTAGFGRKERTELLVLQQKLNHAQSELHFIETEIDKLTPAAPFSGVIRDLPPDLHAGQWLAPDERIATLVVMDSWQVKTYLNEEQLRRIQIGDQGRFYLNGINETIDLQVTRIDSDATRHLPEGILSLAAGGNIETRMQQNQHIPEKAIYRVVLAAKNKPAFGEQQTWRGSVVISGDWEAPIISHFNSALALLWRELGF